MSIRGYIIVVAIILSGCSVPTPSAKIEEIRIPDLDSISSAELGDTMVRYVVATTNSSY